MTNQLATNTIATVGTPWKEQLAGLIRRRPFPWLMASGVRLLVPGHRIGVALVAFNAEDELLLLRHVFHPHIPWGLPGGWLGRNEDPAHGLVRELREETGLKATIGPPLIVRRRSGPSHMIMVFLGWVAPGPVTLSNEILEACWFPLSQLPRPEHPLTRQAVRAASTVRRIFPEPAPELAVKPNLEDNR
jgi:ADP-ribose pyrophosphatase YjhB (NUDIX family)